MKTTASGLINANKISFLFILLGVFNIFYMIFFKINIVHFLLNHHPDVENLCYGVIVVSIVSFMMGRDRIESQMNEDGEVE